MTKIISLIKLGFVKLKSLFSRIKDYLIIGLVVLATGLMITVSVQNKKYHTLDKEYSLTLNNARQYESMLNDVSTDNRVLELKIGDLSRSNDNLIQSLDSTRKALKIKDKDLKLAAGMISYIRDTTEVYLPDTTNCDFLEVIQKNHLTRYTIAREGTKLIHIPDITIPQDLLIVSKKEYRNQNKNFFQRLFTWDFKKDRITRYHLINLNPSVKVEKARIIKINE